MATCKAVRKDGSPCEAQAQAGRPFCFFHDPEKADEARAAQARGGSSREVLDANEVQPWRGLPAGVTVMRTPTPSDVVLLLADTIDEVKTGRIDPRVANAVGYLSNVILKALEVDALNERLAALEEAVGVGRQRP